jgi:hypothetical protein
LSREVADTVQDERRNNLETMGGATARHFLLAVRAAIFDEIGIMNYLFEQRTLAGLAFSMLLSRLTLVRLVGSAYNHGFQVFVRKTNIFPEAPERDLVLACSRV